MDDHDLSLLLTPDHVEMPDPDRVRARGRRIRRRRRVGTIVGGVLAVAVAVVLVPGLPGGSTPVEIGPAGGGQALVDQRTLDAALLTVEDLPAGWTATNPDEQSWSEPGQDAVGVCGHDTTPSAEPLVRASRSFDGSAVLMHWLAAYKSEDAIAGMQKLSEAADSCTTWHQDNDGKTTTWTLEHLDAPDLGDQTVAIRIAADPNGPATFNYEFVAWRDGSVISILGTWDLNNEPGKPSQITSLAKTAATKLGRTLHLD